MERSTAGILVKRQPTSQQERALVMDEKYLKMKTKAYNLCKEYLDGPWAKISEHEFELTVLGGGLTNELYICQLPVGYHCPLRTPGIVLLRTYGLIIQDFVAQIQESVVFSILSERKIGPYLYAVFPGGRLEEYLPCRTLRTEDLSDPIISQNIAKQMAIYHKLTMPLKKEPCCIMDKLQWYFNATAKMEFNDSGKARLLQEFKVLDLEKEIKFIKMLVKESRSPVVFCHNDVQEGNLLHIGNDNDPVQMIDFEYSGYNYRGFDLGNHFCEWMYNYTYQEWPFFSTNRGSYPNKNQKINFIKSYMKEHFSSTKDLQALEEWQLPFIMKEADRFALVSHLFWALWSVVQAKMSDINFGYLEYAHERMSAYFMHKAKVEG